ncbi:MAG: hypothetical protein B7Y62_01110 [Sphingomonadales bacterium 35-56-22]|jgi:hypothetical protein|uniref:hypothetical protein n=1 Tax=Sphingorhabdus sp. TaxID=1902408 RepID=UPI000BCE39E9|nr:hypothetical protein [Sphingorhabdus sp.]OYY16919.1 MAG: hypothetical protein B7Y62_01110 [Sphingomonadales bacterium 35-56-22]OYY99070.1 MAG: hypothetical protein B7Y38_01105 [Sphingomonadales bacterium 28-56-43]OYZ61534.1 MAG: hypothetical protein B7Y10_01820 [Sphingomonadales bacterium 24-56-14]OZA83429.1 MAG: hypothetical protein B7X66_04465 [Sphingomonadales bacterium 39-57-19]HQS12353.1 hypothetical protein [Sphingorhabdus sp.]
MRLIVCALLFVLLQGCVSSVVSNVVTAPIKVVSKTADVLTTSQSESDEKRGRELRKREEAIGKLGRQRVKARKRCANGDREACEKAADLSDQIKREQDRAR